MIAVLVLVTFIFVVAVRALIAVDFALVFIVSIASIGTLILAGIVVCRIVVIVIVDVGSGQNNLMQGLSWDGSRGAEILRKPQISLKTREEPDSEVSSAIGSIKTKPRSQVIIAM